MSEEPTHTNIILEFKMNEQVYKELERLAQEPYIDIILVPLPVRQSLDDMEIYDMESHEREMHMKITKKTRVVRVKDRVLKIAYHDKFCV